MSDFSKFGPAESFRAAAKISEDRGIAAIEKPLWDALKEEVRAEQQLLGKPGL